MVAPLLDGPLECGFAGVFRGLDVHHDIADPEIRTAAAPEAGFLVDPGDRLLCLSARVGQELTELWVLDHRVTHAANIAPLSRR